MRTALVMLALIGGFLLVWRDTMRAREQAMRICREACRRQGGQFLDDTVALGSLGLRRPPGGGWMQVRRIYRFEVSFDGYSRGVGSLILIGARVESLVLPPGGRPPDQDGNHPPRALG